MRKLLLYLIRFYQKYLSFDTGFMHLLFPGSACRYTPRCSEYTYQAIVKYGILHGSVLGLKRILRCHPGRSGGFDPVP
ncbi:membrane protein insertion efficiency factor YidD [Candidatus Amesbacteria bacterium RIFOXYB1_FULL_47_13]|nr:MAG: membrane protein insertion efficiency factor YidD [Candidatus Amesbacteria bacterium RIFOXYB1_FULL_47_13]